MEAELTSLKGRMDRLEEEQKELKEGHKKLEKSDDRIWEFMRELKSEFAGQKTAQLEVSVKVSDLVTNQNAMRSEIAEANGKQESTLNVIKDTMKWQQQQLATREENKDKVSERRWATTGKFLSVIVGIITGIVALVTAIGTSFSP